jgi:hypothetical protein
MLCARARVVIVVAVVVVAVPVAAGSELCAVLCALRVNGEMAPWAWAHVMHVAVAWRGVA